MLRAILGAGFYPTLVIDSVASALGEDGVDGFFVHHEATFAHDGVGRHISVLALTSNRLVIVHIDDQNDERGLTSAMSSTESIPLRSIRSVGLTRSVAHPEAYGTDNSAVTETWLAVAWGTVNKIDLEPATCGDPNCEADHGLTGTQSSDDLVIRISATGDGDESVAQLVKFASLLSQRVH